MGKFNTLCCVAACCAKRFSLLISYRWQNIETQNPLVLDQNKFQMWAVLWLSYKKMSQVTYVTIVPATKDRFTNNLPDLSKLICVPINTDEQDKITSNMGTIFSNMLETVAPIKWKKVREKLDVPWYNSYTHSLKKETRNLELKWRKTNLEVFRIAWKNSMSSYRQVLKAARTEYIRKLIYNNQNNPSTII